MSGDPGEVGSWLDASARGTLDAALERLIPTDALGPGAVQTGVGDYIVRRLDPRDVASAKLCAGLAALDDVALRRLGRSFAQLDDGDRTKLLAAAEVGELGPGLRSFFAQLHRQAMEGMFGDPRHGGNADRAGWALIGYPGPRWLWTDEDQRIEELG